MELWEIVPIYHHHIVPLFVNSIRVQTTFKTDVGYLDFSRNQDVEWQVLELHQLHNAPIP